MKAVHEFHGKHVVEQEGTALLNFCHRFTQNLLVQFPFGVFF